MIASIDNVFFMTVFSFCIVTRVPPLQQPAPVGSLAGDLQTLSGKHDVTDTLGHRA